MYVCTYIPAFLRAAVPNTRPPAVARRPGRKGGAYIGQRGDRGGVPRADVGVEGGCALEHAPHVRHGRDVPLAYVGVEGGLAVEQVVHGAHRRRVPVGDVAVRRRRGRRARDPRRRRRADVRVRDGRLRLRHGREGAAEEHCPDEPTAIHAARDRR